MSYIDLLLVVPIAFGTFKGFNRGLIGEIFRLAALVIGLAGAVQLASIITPMLPPGPYSPLFVYGISFILLVIAVRMIGSFLSKGLKALGLGIFNSIGGAAIGFFRAAIIVSAIIWLVGKTRVLDSAEMKASPVRAALAPLAPAIWGMLGSEIELPGVKKPGQEV